MPAAYIRIDLPYNSISQVPNVEYTRLERREYEHELLTVGISGVPLRTLNIRTGDPIQAHLKGLDADPMVFVGYIHEPLDKASLSASDVGKTTELLAVGATWVMKNPVQKVWTNMTVSAIARQIINGHSLAADVEDSTLVIPQITQAGESDWAFLCRIAKRYGYVVYPTGVTVHFHSRLRDMDANAKIATTLTYRPFGSSVSTDIFHMTATLSEASSDRVGKAQRTYTTVDPSTGTVWSAYNDGTPTQGSRVFHPPATFRDYATPLATSPADLQMRLAGTQEAAAWNHLARAKTVGVANLAPTSQLNLIGLGGDYDGLWTVVGVRYDFRFKTSFRMHVDLGTNTLGPSAYAPDTRARIPLTPGANLRKPQSVLTGPSAISALSIADSRNNGMPFVLWTSDIATAPSPG